MGFLMYGWDRGWRDYESQGLSGQPMVHAASNGFSRHHLQLGDTVYVAAQRERRMILVGRLPVDEVVSRRVAERRVGVELIDKREHVLAYVPTSMVRFDREVPEHVARSLRTMRGSRVAFESDTEYILKRTALQPMVWLDLASAQALDEVLLDDFVGDPPDDSVIGRRAGEASAAMRQAIERWAMECAIEHFHEDGWTVIDVSADHPYDLHCARDGDYVCVEVKGTIGVGERVNLTANEVRNAREQHPRTALALVRRIDLDLTREEPLASGGEMVVHMPWEVEDEALEPNAFYYTPPN